MAHQIPSAMGSSANTRCFHVWNVPMIRRVTPRMDPMLISAISRLMVFCVAPQSEQLTYRTRRARATSAEGRDPRVPLGFELRLGLVANGSIAKLRGDDIIQAALVPYR